ncbi:MAG: ribonuclease P protein component 4 [Candidatus Nanoarchaeia archaeon]
MSAEKGKNTALEKKNRNSRMQRVFKQRKDVFRDVARTRINVLFEEAEKVFSEDRALSDRYVFLARNISLKFKVPFSREQKLRCCRNCGAFLAQGKNASVRLSKGNVVVKCFSCKSIRRYKFK